MNRTYEEILGSMKNAYFEECGTVPESNSPTMKRFEILASELFSVSCYGDYIYKQAFVQSATGECLDKLGAMCGCERKRASCSEGELTFRISEAYSENFVIPENTVCSVEGEPYLQFSTTEQGIIEPNEVEVTVKAVSLGSGGEYNVDKDKIKVMVNAPVGVAYVTNSSAFNGGCSDEDDAAYRGRILRHYAILPNGINCTSFENQILTLDYITDCRIVPASDTSDMIIYIATRLNSLTDAQRREIADKVSVIDATGVPYSIQIAPKRMFTLKIDATVMTGFEKSSVRTKMMQRVNGIVAAARIGESIPLRKLRKAFSDIEGLLDYSIYSSNIVNDTIMNNDASQLLLMRMAVTCNYE